MNIEGNPCLVVKCIIDFGNGKTLIVKDESEDIDFLEVIDRLMPFVFKETYYYIV